MSIFWYEFLYFLIIAFGILVSVSIAVLFIVTYRYERRMRTAWRFIGFIALAIALLFFIIQRKEPSVLLISLIIQAFAFYAILRGVLAEPSITHLKKTGEVKSTGVNGSKKGKKKSRGRIIRIVIGLLIGLVIIGFFVLPGYFYIGPYLPSLLELVALAFIIITIVYQYRRYAKEKKKDGKTRRNNLYPLVAYILFALSTLIYTIHLLPDPDIVILRQMSLEYSVAWIAGAIGYGIAFFFLALWAWPYVKARPFLRTYVTFLTIVVFVATFGALIFTLFAFKIIERNNYELMLKGAESQVIVMDDRANTGMFVARLIAEDEEIANYIQNNDYDGLLSSLNRYLQSADVDILRVYNVFGEVVASPSDIRERGEVYANDNLVAYSILERAQARSYDTAPGVLVDYISTRAVHPILVNGAVIGSVEVGYLFDNAFVDFSKELSDLDVSIYTGNKISATTMKTADGVSRFVGTEETDPDINQEVLERGFTYTAIQTRFGEIYYSAFRPLRDVNGNIIGMVSVGTPIFVHLEAARQQLLTTFIIVTLLSLLVSAIGYYSIPQLRGSTKKAKKK